VKTDLVKGEDEEPISSRGTPKRVRKAQRPVLAVPPLCPASLEPAWLRGRLILPQDPPGPGGDFVVLAAALRIVRGEIIALAGDAECDGSIDERTIACLRNVAARIPGFVPAQNEFFFVAHMKGFLQAGSRAVHDCWPVLLAKRYDEVIWHFDRTLQQFPKWREFTGTAEKDRLTPVEMAGVPALADIMIAALREDAAQELADSEIAGVLEALCAPLKSIAESIRQQVPVAMDESKLLLAYDLLGSIENIAKRTAEAALRSDRKGSVPAGTIEEPAGEKNDRGIAPSWMRRTLAGIAGAASASTLCSRLCWLEPIVAALGPS
jgi:hypothetical protein